MDHLHSIKGNVRKLLELTDFKSINAVMKAKGMSKPQAEQWLLDNHNQIVDKINFKAKQKKNEDEKKKRNKKISEVIKNQLKKIQEMPAKAMRVVIDIEFEATIKDRSNDGKLKTYKFNETVDKEFAVPQNRLNETVSEFVANQVFEDSSKTVKPVSHTVQIVQNMTKVNKLDVPMKRAKPLKPSFLDWFHQIDDIAYEDFNDMCVPKALQHHLKIKKEKTITDVFREASQKLYSKEWSVKDGVTARMIEYFCKVKQISCLGLDQKSKCFVKYNPTNRCGAFKPIVFYMVAGHFYLITKDIQTIAQVFKENKLIVSSILKEETEKVECTYVDFETVSSADINALDEDEHGNDIVHQRNFQIEFERMEQLPENTTVLASRSNLNEELIQYIKIYNECPKLKYDSKSNCKSIKLKNNITLTTTDCLVGHKTIQSICENQSIPYKNQSIGTLLMDLASMHFRKQSKRIALSPDVIQEVLQRQEGVCVMCKSVTKLQIDHIRPLANGGTNDLSNLQGLCKTCHREKSQDERANCEYLTICDYLSCYNIEAYNAIKSKFFTKVQFTQNVLRDDEIEQFKDNGYHMFSIDENKCRRNLLINYLYDFPVYSCLDNIAVFDGHVTTGFYYVETDNIFPLRKNGFYAHPLVEYCLQHKIISKFDIKLQYKPSLKIPKDYFKPFVSFLLEVFAEDSQLQKLAINAFIGMLGRRENSFIDCAIVDRNNESDFASVYSNFQAPYVNVLNDDFAVITQSINIEKLENAFPIFAQILDCEAMELHKMTTLLSSNGFIPVCVKTDAVVYFSKENAPLDISGFYWDEQNSIPKYKHEEACMIKRSIHYSNTDRFILQSKKFNVIKDTGDFNFNVEVAKHIIDMKKGCFLDGLAGTGKTKLINEINKLIADKNVKRLTPTNVSALLINGETIDKFAHTALVSSKSIANLKHLEYIFIDEISMMKEIFYTVFLSIKFHHPNIKFIISGDFNQLEPVNDRKRFNYEMSRALFELVDGNKLYLTRCRRSDDTLFNLYNSILQDKTVDISDMQDRDWLSYTNLCYTNQKRVEVNKRCMERYLAEQCPKVTHSVAHLEYDKNTQDYTLCAGMPLISRLNKKSLDVLNNEMFICKKIKSDSIVVENEFKELEISKDDFKRLFNLAFCVTIHKSQGLSLKERYVIYEWSRLNKKLAYVAISRATDKNNIHII
jgi:5-methylcytosine-specific restriction enzyme A